MSFKTVMGRDTHSAKLSYFFMIKSVQTCLSGVRISVFDVSPVAMIVKMPLQAAVAAQRSQDIFILLHSTHVQSTVFVENDIFADNKTVHTVMLQLYYYEALELPHKVSLFLVHCSHPSLIQSNYAAIHPQANQTFNSPMEPHFIIGLCSETNKQSSSRLVIPLTATHAESAKLAANKVKKKNKKNLWRNPTLVQPMPVETCQDAWEASPWEEE